MPTTIDSLSAADRADFEGRLGKFGLDASAILSADLVVPPKTQLTLSLNGADSFAHPHLLVTKDLDEAKQWIGLPDSHFQRGLLKAPIAPPPLHPAMPPIEARAAATAVGAEAIASPALDSRQLDNVRKAAVSYIWGNSAESATYKQQIQKLFPVMQIPIWLFMTITVSAGSTLQLGPGYNVLCAWKIVIQEGGTIASRGGLKVECTILQKQNQIIFHPLPFPLVQNV